MILTWLPNARPEEPVHLGDTQRFAKWVETPPLIPVQVFEVAQSLIDLQLQVASQDRQLALSLDFLTLEREAAQKAIERQYAQILHALSLQQTCLLDAVHTDRVNAANRSLDERFRRIDLSFLSACRPNVEGKQLPTFLTFPLDQEGFFGIQAVGPTNPSIVWAIPEAVRRHYGATAELLAKELSRQWHYQKLGIFATFNGVIPGEIRRLIQRETEAATFDELLLVTEAPTNWTVQWSEKRFPLDYEDPLLIGRKGDHFWLLACFDLTFSEQFAVKLFT